MAKLKINQAINNANRVKENKGERKVLKKEIGARLWPDSNDSARQVNLSKLLRGATKSISADQVSILCEVLGCTPNDLFEYKK